MTVVTNTSPLNYLLLIGEVQLLLYLFQELHLPVAVRDELRDPAAAISVRKWAEIPPDWAKTHIVIPAPLPSTIDLHPGETEAILLAQTLHADLLLMDELDGRAAARNAGLTVIGTLGVLDRAAAHKLVDFPSALKRLQTTNFRATPRLVAELLHRDNLRRR
jgi:predicted nucleic acid-binding protein